MHTWKCSILIKRRCWSVDMPLFIYIDFFATRNSSMSVCDMREFRHEKLLIFARIMLTLTRTANQAWNATSRWWYFFLVGRSRARPCAMCMQLFHISTSFWSHTTQSKTNQYWSWLMTFTVFCCEVFSLLFRITYSSMDIDVLAYGNN